MPSLGFNQLARSSELIDRQQHYHSQSCIVCLMHKGRSARTYRTRSERSRARQDQELRAQDRGHRFYQPRVAIKTITSIILKYMDHSKYEYFSHSTTRPGTSRSDATSPASYQVSTKIATNVCKRKLLNIN